MLCNGGLLVSDSAHDILPDYAIGFVGEIDVLPGRMTILMNREGFQKDELWDVFCRDIREHYRKIIEEKIDTWIAERGMGSEDSDYRRAVQRAILLMLYSPLSEVVGQRNVEKASRLDLAMYRFVIERYLRLGTGFVNRAKAAAAIRP